MPADISDNWSRKIFVSNLPPETNDEDLYRFFDSVIHVRRTVDVTCNRFYRTVCVWFSSQSQAHIALKKDGDDFMGYSIRVTRSSFQY